MKNDKPFKTVNEQIDLLESRGMYIGDRETAKRFLHSYGYYQVVNAYKEPFLERSGGDKRYREGTTFGHLCSLYLFDDSLRRTTLAPILEAERVMKTSVVYSFCAKHGGVEDYLDPSCYCTMRDYAPKRSEYTKNLIKLLSTLLKLNANSCHKESIAHYRKHHGGVPLWVLAGSMTFGNTSAFFDLQERSVQDAACKALFNATGKRVTREEMRDAYRTLSPFRNICAHGDRLFCARVSSRNQKSYADLLLSLRAVLPDSAMGPYLHDLSGLMGMVYDMGPFGETVLNMMGFHHKGPGRDARSSGMRTLMQIVTPDGEVLTPWVIADGR